MGIQIKNIVIGEGKPVICAPLVGRTKEEILHDCGRIMMEPVEMVEWRVDFYNECFDLDSVISVLKEIKELLDGTPIVFTYRTWVEGGESMRDSKDRIVEKDYYRLIDGVARTGLADIIDIEVISYDERILRKLIDAIQCLGGIVMGSSHDFKETPLNENMSQIFERMNLLHVDIMKLAVMPQNTEDVVRMLQFAEEANRKYKQPLVTMSMGQLGLVSRMMGNITGSAITFASVGKASAPGQMPAKKMKEILELLNHKKHLFFIGFMGCGKSTITEYLAKKLSLQHIDTDHKIEAEQNTTIENIFKENGEDYFRTLENQLLRQLETIQPSVIACGGGMAIKQENVAIMKRCGIVIMLKASPETIFERVRYSKKRPLLNGNMNTLYIKNLMSDRVSIYEQAADFIIDTDQRKPDEIVDDIINTLKKRN